MPTFNKKYNSPHINGVITEYILGCIIINECNTYDTYILV